MRGKQTPDDVLDDSVHVVGHSAAVHFAAACVVKETGAQSSVARVVTLAHGTQGQVVEEVTCWARASAGGPGVKHVCHLAVAGGIGLAGAHFRGAFLAH